MSAKGPTTEQGIPQTPWGFLRTLGCDLRSQEMSPGPNHTTFPAHPRMGLSPSSFSAEVTPSLSPSSPPHLPPASPEVCLFHPRHQSPRTLILSLRACACTQDLPLSEALSFVLSPPRLSPGGWQVVWQAMIWLYQSPFPLHHMPLWHTSRLWGSF